MTTRYYIRLPNPAAARGSEPACSFRSQSAEGFAEELQSALREALLFECWRARQQYPDNVDPALGTTDPEARVAGTLNDLSVDLEVITRLPSALLRQRLGLLAGNHWQLRDVASI